MQRGYDNRVISVHKVVDGDTVDLVVDVGFRSTLTPRVRLAVIDCPDRREDPAGWLAAKNALTLWLATHGSGLRVASYLEDSFRRWIADVYDPATGETASAALLAGGHAEVWIKNLPPPTVGSAA